MKEDDKLYSMIFTYVIICCLLIGFVIYINIPIPLQGLIKLDPDHQKQPDKPRIGHLEEWNYSKNEGISDANCVNYCISLEYDIDYCNEMCINYKRSFYTDSYCDFNCIDSNYTINIRLGIDESIPASIIEPSDDCNYTCYGIVEYYGY